MIIGWYSGTTDWDWSLVDHDNWKLATDGRYWPSGYLPRDDE